jgi:hypothetical protein
MLPSGEGYATTNEYNFMSFEVFHSGVSEDSCHLVCGDAALLMFQRNVLSLSVSGP